MCKPLSGINISEEEGLRAHMRFSLAITVKIFEGQVEKSEFRRNLEGKTVCVHEILNDNNSFWRP